MTENLSLNGAGGVTKRLTFEQKRRAAFEEWFRDRLLRYGVCENEAGGAFYQLDGEYTYPEANDCWQAWQAALEWANKVESE